ncbi:glutamine synthetase-like isoform X2 [Convolutriloba macropyga]|uniref:glutamine synthetase-like isoform X2 n=1 Tax=Convolutriloba macropyga TaxID=536237 RepID=UPI003F520621
MGSSAQDRDADFVRFVYCDNNGVPRAKTVPRRNYNRLSKPGAIGLPNCLCVMSTTSLLTYYSIANDDGFPDCYAVPDLDTWHLCQWSGSKSGRKVASVLCEMKEKDKELTPCGFDTRYISRKLVKELEIEFGLKLYSALEYEFGVGKGGKPLTAGLSIYVPIFMKEAEDFCYDVSDRLEAAGVYLETLMSEHGDGQLELTMEPSWGVKAADDAFIYKQCAKETAIDHGIMATFMCNPWLQVQNGGHYNFSAWKDGVSVFTDNSDPDGLSEIGKNWVAGLMEHAPALTALVCHTNNCYSRFFEGGFAPYHICYAVENRSAMVRIKRAESSGTHLEFRLPGAAANPYIVVLATVAAGLDGLRRKLKPPPSGFSDAKQIPRTLESALNALESDKVLCDIIGDDLITPFLLSKRAHDLPLKTFEEQFAAYSHVL